MTAAITRRFPRSGAAAAVPLLAMLPWLELGGWVSAAVVGALAIGAAILPR